MTTIHHRHTDDCWGEIDGRLICPLPPQRQPFTGWSVEPGRKAEPVTRELHPVDRPRFPLITWSLLVSIVAIAIVAFLIANRAAASRSAQTTDLAPSRDVSAIAEISSAGLTGAPHDEAIPRTRGIEPATTSDPAHQAVVGAPQIQTGVASWYDDGPGHYAAAPWWRSGMDPAPVSVCRIDAGRSDCVSVIVQDHCQCLVGTSRERIIDLSADAFAELAPLSVGLIRVQVDRGAGPTPPPTDIEEGVTP